jgi:hypothetical protein
MEKRPSLVATHRYAVTRLVGEANNAKSFQHPFTAEMVYET